MREGAFEAAANQPAVEGIVAVLDQHGALCESQEGPACVAELGRTDQHRPVDVMALFRIGVDRRAAVDERVEKGQRAAQFEPLGAELEDEKRRVACGLDIDGHELRLVQRGLRAEFGRIDSNLLPLHRLPCATRLQEDWFHDCRRIAERTKSISSRVIARIRMTATA